MANAEALAPETIDAITNNDTSRYRALLHPEYTYRGPDGQVQRGPDAGVAIVQTYRTAFPDDMALDIQGIHSAGDKAMEFIGKGTHRGELAGIAPTGRRVEIPIVTVLEIRDGKVHTEREYFDNACTLQHLGLMPAPATA
jgi:steroid delta-isomerase-like uncharacterized protein